MMDAKIVTAEEVKVQIETLQGPQGERGAQGPQGERGERGPQGIQGPAGARGEKGERGERGEKGATGERGPQGLPGRDGADGRDGAAGARGPQGAQGLQGERGEPGPAGRDGVDGIQGFSPIVDLERLDDGVLITVQNKDGNKIARVFDGKNAENKLEDIFIIHFNEYVNASQEPIEEIINAIDAGKVVIGVTPSGVIYEYAGLKTYINKASETAHTFQTHIDPFNRNAVSRFTQIKTDNSDFISSGQNISAKNPYKLILSGAVKAEYDGSKQVNITIPEGDTGGELFIVRYDPATKLADKTQAEIRAAVAQKTPCIALDSAGRVYSYVGEEAYHKDKNVLVPTFRHAMDYDEAGNVSFKELQIPGSGEMHIWGNTKVKAPNPKTLWIKGSGISALYDGSEQVTITLPEGGGEGSGLPEGGEPHQMLVTDGEGNTKWDERTHYKETVVVLPETILYNDKASIYYITSPFSRDIVKGNSYVVNFCGVDYETVAKTVEYGGNSALGLGNVDVADDTGEPFGICLKQGVVDDIEYYATVQISTGEGSLTISIRENVCHKLPNEYLDIPLTSVTVDILPKMTLTGEEGSLPIIEPFAGEIVVGNTYTVTYNGTEYTCTAFPLQETEDAPILPSVGNQAAIGGEDTGEPFFIAYAPPEVVEMVGAYGIAMDLTGASSATVKIQGAGGVKIDNSALDLDWIPKKQKAGETIVGRTTLLYSPAYLTNIGEDIAEKIGDAAHYIAFVDGLYYRTGAWRAPDGSVTIIGNGRSYIQDESIPETGEPFAFVLSDEGLVVFIGEDTPDGTHEIALYHDGGTQTLPLAMPRSMQASVKPIIQQFDNNFEETADEIETAFGVGRMTYVIDEGGAFVPLTGIANQKLTFRMFRDGEETVITYDERKAENLRWDKVKTRYVAGDIDSVVDAVIAKIPSAEGVGF